MNPLELRRIDEARNTHRFYRLAIEPDLLGGFRLLRQWWRIGSFSQIKAVRYDNETLASDALQPG